MTKERRGICSVCQEERSVTAGDKVRQHFVKGAYGFRLSSECAGTGRQPASFVVNPIVAAERRGYEKAIADLRAEAARGMASVPESTYYEAYDRAADFLEAPDA